MAWLKRTCLTVLGLAAVMLPPESRGADSIGKGPPASRERAGRSQVRADALMSRLKPVVERLRAMGPEYGGPGDPAAMSAWRQSLRAEIQDLLPRLEAEREELLTAARERQMVVSAGLLSQAVGRKPAGGDLMEYIHYEESPRAAGKLLVEARAALESDERAFLAAAARRARERRLRLGAWAAVGLTLASAASLAFRRLRSKEAPCCAG